MSHESTYSVVAHIQSRIDGAHLGMVFNPTLERLMAWSTLFDVIIEVLPQRSVA